MPLPVVCQPYYNLLNRDARGRDPARLRLLRHRRRAVFADRARRADRQVRVRRRARGLARRAQGPADAWRRSSARNRSRSRRSSRRTPRRPAARSTQFALAWLWANQIVTSVIAGPRTFEQWQRLRRRARHEMERRRRGARRFAGRARASVDARLHRSAVSVLRADRRLSSRLDAPRPRGRRCHLRHPLARRRSANGSRFSGGDSGHDQRSSYAHDGLYAKLKSSTIVGAGNAEVRALDRVVEIAAAAVGLDAARRVGERQPQAAAVAFEPVHRERRRRARAIENRACPTRVQRSTPSAASEMSKRRRARAACRSRRARGTPDRSGYQRGPSHAARASAAIGLSGCSRIRRSRAARNCAAAAGASLPASARTAA